MEGQVALLTMNNGENRFNMDSVTALLSVLDQIEKETDAKALVVRSSDEKVWCNGMDLDWLVPLIQSDDKGATDAFVPKQNELFKRILFIHDHCCRDNWPCFCGRSHIGMLL